MLISEQCFDSDTTFTFKLSDCGRYIMLRAHSPRPKPNWLHEKRKAGRPVSERPSADVDDANMVEALRVLRNNSEPFTFQHFKKNPPDGFSRERAIESLKRLERTGLVSFNRSKGGRGNKTTVQLNVL